MKKRITTDKNKYNWYIAIDDGYVSYLFTLKASNTYSIDSLFKKIQKSIGKK